MGHVLSSSYIILEEKDSAKKRQFDRFHPYTLSVTLQTCGISFREQRVAKYTNTPLNLLHPGKIVLTKKLDNKTEELEIFCKCFTAESHKPAILNFFYYKQLSNTVSKNI